VRRRPAPSAACLLHPRSTHTHTFTTRLYRMALLPMRAGRGQVGALLLAGGQGTRLGSDAPKGCYDIGLPSHKPLFQYHAEKVLGVRSLAASALGIHISEVRLPLLVMTSDATDGPTRRFWAERDHFGLPEDQVSAEICAERRAPRHHDATGSGPRSNPDDA